MDIFQNCVQYKMELKTSTFEIGYFIHWQREYADYQQCKGMSNGGKFLIFLRNMSIYLLAY